MKTPKKIWKSIAKKFKNWKGSKETAIQKPSVSSSADSEEAKKPLEITIEQSTTIPAEEYSKEVHEKPVIDN